MRVIENCAVCLYNRQLRLTDNQAYLAEIRDIIDNRGEEVTAPCLVYRFDQTNRFQVLNLTGRIIEEEIDGFATTDDNDKEYVHDEKHKLMNFS